MASVATEERSVSASTRRTPSEKARQVGEAFAELQEYFPRPKQLREALEWSAPTLRHWLQEQGPARPRASSVERVFHLRDVAREAASWVSDPCQVGEWLVAPNPALRDVSPARVVALLGQEGVDQLVARMPSIAPREWALPEPVEVSPDELRATLRSLGAPVLGEVPNVDDADIDVPYFD